MPLFLKSALNVSAFCVTWLVVRRLMGETAFSVGDGVAMAVASVGTLLATRWAERRKAGAA